MAMTDRNKRFVKEYMRDRNATQAAIRAGYCPINADVTGPRTLRKEDVKKAIAAEQAKLAAVCGVDLHWIVEHLVAIVENPNSKPRDVIMALDKLAKLLGLDQPQRLEVTTDGAAAIGIIEIPAASEGEI